FSIVLFSALVSCFSFVCTSAATSAIYTLSLHDALPISSSVKTDGVQPISARTTGYTFNHTMLRVKDPAKSLAFYTGVLGMTLLRSEEHTSELQSRENLVCRLLLEKKNQYIQTHRMRIPK